MTAAAISALAGLAGIPREIRSPLAMEATRLELERTYGLRLAAGQPSWRGARAQAKAPPPATYILRAPDGTSAIIDGQGRLRAIVNGLIAVNAQERAALLQQVGWSPA
jgi:hypothetical protein